MYLYILTNPSLPNLVKIGSTKKNPIDRAKELSSTSIPTPFSVYYQFNIPSISTEFKVHKHLRTFRSNKNREFFQLSPANAKSKIQAFLNQIIPNTNNSQLHNIITKDFTHLFNPEIPESYHHTLDIIEKQCWDAAFNDLYGNN